MERLAIFRGGWLTGGKFLLFLLFWISKSLILLRAAQAGDKEGNIIGSEVGDTIVPTVVAKAAWSGPYQDRGEGNSCWVPL